MADWAAGLLQAADRTAGLLQVAAVLLFCPALGQTPFTVTAAQDVYQAQENSNVTLTWLFPINTDKSPRSLTIDVAYLKSMTRVYLYDSRSEAELYPHEHYRGRVHCDPELAWRGRVECVFTKLRLDDTGVYQCVVRTDRHSNYKTCDLNVTAASDGPVDEPPQPETRGEHVSCSQEPGAPPQVQQPAGHMTCSEKTSSLGNLV